MGKRVARALFHSARRERDGTPGDQSEHSGQGHLPAQEGLGIDQAADRVAVDVPRDLVVEMRKTLGPGGTQDADGRRGIYVLPDRHQHLVTVKVAVVQLVLCVPDCLL